MDAGCGRAAIEVFDGPVGAFRISEAVCTLIRDVLAGAVGVAAGLPARADRVARGPAGVTGGVSLALPFP